MIGELKIFLDQYKIYNEIKLVETKDTDDQAIFYGHIKCIEATQSFIRYFEEQE